MKIWKYALIGTLVMPTSTWSQGRSQASQEQFNRINNYVQRLPDEACKLPKDPIEQQILANLEGGDLMEAVRKTVFFEPDTAPKLSGYDALLEKSRQESDRSYAAAQAYYSGRQVPVGQPVAAAKPRYRVELSDIKATDRIDDGLNCSANVRAGAVRFAISYTVALNPANPGGLNINTNMPPLTEASALAQPDRIKIHFQLSYTETKDLSLAEARAAAAALRAARLESGRQRDAATPRSSPAAYRGCQGLEAGVAKIIEGNSNGLIQVIEVATFEDSAGARADGTLSCSGRVFTNRGQVFGDYGTSRSPKGQLLIEWRPR